MRSSYRVSSHLLVVIEDLSPPFFYYFFAFLSLSLSLSLFFTPFTCLFSYLHIQQAQRGLEPPSLSLFDKILVRETQDHVKNRVHALNISARGPVTSTKSDCKISIR